MKEHATGSDVPDPLLCAKVLRQLEEQYPNPEAIWSAFRAGFITEEQVFRLLPETPKDDTLLLIVRDGLRELCANISSRIKNSLLIQSK